MDWKQAKVACEKYWLAGDFHVIIPPFPFLSSLATKKNDLGFSFW